ncbi:MAG: hypothetical protein LBT17_03485 [Mycoplasmataceae bacterium]|nr:hypothetical protein [Mycoplasmataceae bacterium]
MDKQYNIWKVPGFHWEKFLFILSCFLIYPIFLKRTYERYIERIVESLTLLQFNLMKLVRFRQNSIAVVYIKYHKTLPPVIEGLCRDIIGQEITIYNFKNIELEIEGIMQLVDSNQDCDREMATEFLHILTWSEQEFNNVMQSYNSHFDQITQISKRTPWKLFFTIFKLKNLELEN